MSEMLRLTGVRKSFDGTEVLHGIDLAVNKGEVVAVLGPSGSGKTTLLRCANFLERADAGTLSLGGETYDLARATHREVAAVRRRAGFVFQSYNLFRNRTVLGNVTEGLVVARRVPKAEAEARAHEMLEHVGMDDRCDAYPVALSGGQQQRVAIARAMATDPEIIYFDEPTSALDPELTGEVLAVILPETSPTAWSSWRRAAWWQTPRRGTSLSAPPTTACVPFCARSMPRQHNRATTFSRVNVCKYDYLAA